MCYILLFAIDVFSDYYSNLDVYLFWINYVKVVFSVGIVALCTFF